MDTHNLHYVGDMRQTCLTSNSKIHGVIDLTLVTEDLREGTLLRGRYLTAAVSIVIERYEVEGTLLSTEYRSGSYEGSQELS